MNGMCMNGLWVTFKCDRTFEVCFIDNVCNYVVFSYRLWPKTKETQELCNTKQ